MLRRLLKSADTLQLHRFKQLLGNGILAKPAFVFRGCLHPCPTSNYPAISSCRTLFTAGSKDDTIYALSTAQGTAGIAVIRVSGPCCQEIYNGLCPKKPLPKPRYVALRTLFHPGSDSTNMLDAASVVLYMPGPKTVTGEDVLELHVHGGNATVKAVLSAIPKCSTRTLVRYAEPGEFTKRAFLNDRLDLSQVEALSATLSAETEQQRRAAVRGSSGALGKTYEGWRQKLVQARAQMEAFIDFSEDQRFDEDEESFLKTVEKQVQEIVTSIKLHETASQRSELLRNGFRIALLGPPNVGKSSLMNQIVGREASIVSSEAGTTRDIVEVHLDIRGYLCNFADTAGFRSENSQVVHAGSPAKPHESIIGAVEQEGIRRARTKALESDVVIVLAAIEVDPSGNYYINYDRETLKLLSDVGNGFVLVNKRDLVDEHQFRLLIDDFQASVLSSVEGLDPTVIPISCKQTQDVLTKESTTGGVNQVADHLASIFAAMTSLPPNLQDLHGVTERQRQLLEECRQHLENFLLNGNATNPGYDLVVAAEELRYAANCLARITGRGEFGDIEEVLGVIFEKFCVGK